MATYLQYLDAAMKQAQVERMEDGKYFAFIPKFEGLWASGDTEEAAKRDLYQALDGWIDVQIKISRDKIPDLDGVCLYVAPALTER